jgi:hypothetical protein
VTRYEVEIDRLVLHGVSQAEAPVLLAAFHRHLAALLAAAPTRGTAPAEAAAGSRHAEPSLAPNLPSGLSAQSSGPQPPEPAGERLGRQLAHAVVRAVRR